MLLLRTSSCWKPLASGSGVTSPEGFELSWIVPWPAPSVLVTRAHLKGTLRDDADVDFPGGLEAVGFFLVLQVPPCTCCGCPAHCRLGHAPQWLLLIHGWRLTCSRVGRASGSLDSIHEIKLRASVKKTERKQPVKSLDYGNKTLVLFRERKQNQSYFCTPEYELFC